MAALSPTASRAVSILDDAEGRAQTFSPGNKIPPSQEPHATLHVEREQPSHTDLLRLKLDVLCVLIQGKMQNVIRSKMPIF